MWGHLSESFVSLRWWSSSWRLPRFLRLCHIIFPASFLSSSYSFLRRSVLIFIVNTEVYMFFFFFFPSFYIQIYVFIYLWMIIIIIIISLIRFHFLNDCTTTHLCFLRLNYVGVFPCPFLSRCAEIPFSIQPITAFHKNIAEERKRGKRYTRGSFHKRRQRKNARKKKKKPKRKIIETISLWF